MFEPAKISRITTRLDVAHDILKFKSQQIALHTTKTLRNAITFLSILRQRTTLQKITSFLIK